MKPPELKSAQLDPNGPALTLYYDRPRHSWNPFAWLRYWWRRWHVRPPKPEDITIDGQPGLVDSVAIVGEMVVLKIAPSFLGAKVYETEWETVNGKDQPTAWRSDGVLSLRIWWRWHVAPSDGTQAGFRFAWLVRLEEAGLAEGNAPTLNQALRDAENACVRRIWAAGARVEHWRAGGGKLAAVEQTAVHTWPEQDKPEPEGKEVKS